MVREHPVLIITCFPLFLCPCCRQEGVSFEEVKSFARLVDSIVDVEMALSMHSAAGASITAGGCGLLKYYQGTNDLKENIYFRCSCKC